MPDAPPAPGRSERKICWGTRDRYFDCLDAVGVVEPGKESVSQCSKEMLDYDKNCARSWVEYFNTRRVKEAQTRAEIRAYEASGVDTTGMRYSSSDKGKAWTSKG